VGCWQMHRRAKAWPLTGANTGYQVQRGLSCEMESLCKQAELLSFWQQCTRSDIVVQMVTGCAMSLAFFFVESGKSFFLLSKFSTKNRKKRGDRKSFKINDQNRNDVNGNKFWVLGRKTPVFGNCENNLIFGPCAWWHVFCSRQMHTQN